MKPSGNVPIASAMRSSVVVGHAGLDRVERVAVGEALPAAAEAFHAALRALALLHRRLDLGVSLFHPLAVLVGTLCRRPRAPPRASPSNVSAIASASLAATRRRRLLGELGRVHLRERLLLLDHLRLSGWVNAGSSPSLWPCLR